MKLVQILVFSLPTLLAALMLTNPSKQQYSEHLAWTFQTTMCRQQQQSLKVRSVCSAISVLPYDTAAGFISEYSQRENFLLFSMYRTNFLGLENRSIGVVRVFLPHPGSSPSAEVN